MNKLLIFLTSFITAIFLISLASAIDYGYSSSYTQKTTLDAYGYTYYQKSVDQTPFGETTSYKQVKDYTANTPSFFIYNRDPYKNPVSDYWNYGPYQGYSSTVKYVTTGYPAKVYSNNVYIDNRYSDAYVRATTGSQYYHYYNEPTKVYVADRYGGSMYWDHGYQGYDCGNGYYCWR